MNNNVSVRFVPTADNSTLRAHFRILSGAPAVVLFNAVGIPSAIFDPVMNQLAERYTVITWDCRGLPSPGPISSSAFSYENHVHDAEHIFAAFDVTRAHLIGWCSGADVAVLFALRHPKQIATLTLVNGAYGFAEPELSSDYEGLLTRLFNGFLRNEAMRADIHRALLSVAESRFLPCDNQDTSLGEILKYPFQTVDRLNTYAHLCLAAKRGRRVDTFAYLRVPTLYVSALRDPIQPYTSSVRAHELTPGSKLHVLRDGDHNIIYTRPEVPELISDFLDL